MGSSIILATETIGPVTTLTLFPDAVPNSEQLIFQSIGSQIDELEFVSGISSAFEIRNSNEIYVKTAELLPGAYKIHLLPTDEVLHVRSMSIVLHNLASTLDRKIRIEGRVEGPDKDEYSVLMDIYPPCFPTEYAATMGRGVLSIGRRAGYQINVALVHRDPVTGELGESIASPSQTIVRSGAIPFALSERSSM